MMLEIAEVARSVELYNLGKQLQTRATAGEYVLAFTREPPLRRREDVGHVVVAFGSYDPLSRAHEGLFLRGLDAAARQEPAGSLEELLIVTATTHWDKTIDWKKNSAIFDRVHAQEGFASCHGNAALALFNDPLFVNLADAVRTSYGPTAHIYLLVGADVMDKIADPAGYARFGLDPNQVLQRLFAHKFIVSERSCEVDGKRQLIGAEDLKKRYPALQQYADRITSLDIRRIYDKLRIPIQDVSSTAIRAKRARHEDVRALEAVGISDFVDKRGIYLQDSTLYAASVCARQRFADEHIGQPIANYIDNLMLHLRFLEMSPLAREEEIDRFGGQR